MNEQDSFYLSKFYAGLTRPKQFPFLPSNWESEKLEFKTNDLKLFAVRHFKKSPSIQTTQKILVVLHGFGEHGGRYLHFPHYLKEVVDQVICLDHRGHGQSQGLKGYVPHFDTFAKDTLSFVEWLKSQSSNELHLFGHSMGGHVALRLGFLYPTAPLQSVIVSAPLLGIKTRVPFLKKVLSKAVGKFLGKLQLDSELDANLVSKDIEVVAAYQKDPFVHRLMTPSLFNSLLEVMEDTLSRTDVFAFKLLGLIPEQDGLADSRVALEFFKDQTQKDHKKIIRSVLLKGAFHESFNDPEKEIVFEEIKKWLT